MKKENKPAEEQEVKNVENTAEETQATETTETTAEQTAADDLADKILKLNDQHLRLMAEFENYKKRTQKDRENIYGMVTSDVVSTMLPIMDNLEKSIKRKNRKNFFIIQFCLINTFANLANKSE